MMDSVLRIGIDLGGTKIAGVLMDDAGNELANLREVIESMSLTPDTVIDTWIYLAEQAKTL